VRRIGFTSGSFLAQYEAEGLNGRLEFFVLSIVRGVQDIVSRHLPQGDP
jgi:hypothetical protein